MQPCKHTKRHQICYITIWWYPDNILVCDVFCSTLFSFLLFPAVTVTYPTFLLSRNSDSLVLSLWNQFSLLQLRGLALLLHVSNDRLRIDFHFGTLQGIHSADSEKVTVRGNTHSRSVALSVFRNSCLARRRMSGSNLNAERNIFSYICLYIHWATILHPLAITWHPGWFVSRGDDVSPPAAQLGCPQGIHREHFASHSLPECERRAPSCRQGANNSMKVCTSHCNCRINLYLPGWVLTSAISLYLPSMDVRRSMDCFRATGMPGKECWEVRRWRAPRRSTAAKGERKKIIKWGIELYIYASTEVFLKLFGPQCIVDFLS